MSHYKEIDDLVHRYQKGQESPKGSPERARGKAACDMLVMTFKPLILSTMQHMPGIGPADYEDAYQDGVVAFMEGLKKYDASSGGRFNAFIKTHLQLYYRKWQEGRFDCSVKICPTLDTLAGGSFSLLDAIVDEESDTEKNYLAEEAHKNEKSRLKNGWRDLSATQRSLVYACYAQGIPLREYARIQKKSWSTVKEQHQRALKKFKKYFD